MDEKGKVSRIVRKKLEGYFNREIIEREFDPSGNGLHTTTPLVARLELAYMTAVDKPFRNARKSPSKKHSINKEQKESCFRAKSFIPQTQRDTKLKGRAQTKDVLRLARSSEDALNKISVKDVIDIHRYRSQGVPYEHVSKGKVPHVSHHVHAYLNSEEALRYSQEWNDRKLAQEYKAKCKANSKNKQGRDHNFVTARYSPRSKTWIDFRNMPLTLPLKEDKYLLAPDSIKGKKELLLPTSNSDDLMTSESTEPTDTDSQTSSVRKHYVRTGTGTLPEDRSYPSSSSRKSKSSLNTEKDNDHLQEEMKSDLSGVKQSRQASGASFLEINPERNTEEIYIDKKDNIASLNSKSGGSVSVSPVSSTGEDETIDASQTGSPLSKEQDVFRLIKEEVPLAEPSSGTESRASHNLSSSPISCRVGKRPKTARLSRSTFKNSTDDVKSSNSENESIGCLSGRINDDGATPSALSSVPDLKFTYDADPRFGGSATTTRDDPDQIIRESASSIGNCADERFGGPATSIQEHPGQRISGFASSICDGAEQRFGGSTTSIHDDPDQRIGRSAPFIGNGADERICGSATSIGDASSLLDELSIKSLSLQDTFSGSYSLDFEDDSDDDRSSEFDNISYNSRSRGRSQKGGISPPDGESLRSTRMNVNPSNQSSRTEEYIRTESVVSLR